MKLLTKPSISKPASLVKEAISYNLPDYAILHSDKQADYAVWQPDKTYIVLGRSNRITDDSVYMEKATEDGVEIYKRPSGGEAVVLSPDMLVISVKLPVENPLKTHQYFRLINNSIIDALHKSGISDVHQKGISDISIGIKKILGSSIYRKEKTVFYHAVLNISGSVAIISRYLKHPSKEPDYRKGRDHAEFVTSLRQEGYNTAPEDLKKALAESLKALVSLPPK